MEKAQLKWKLDAAGIQLQKDEIEAGRTIYVRECEDENEWDWMREPEEGQISSSEIMNEEKSIFQS